MTQHELIFSPSEPLTLGVEIEVQLLDPETWDLKPASTVLLPLCEPHTDRIKAELFQSMIEINTGVCNDAHEIRKDLTASLEILGPIAKNLGLRLASSGTHPFANYNGRLLYPATRYQNLIDRNKWIARRLMIFGLHIHIGMRSGDHAIQMNNALLHYLPMLLAITASSPYWHAEDTELASSRITFFEALPTGGHPCRVDSWDEFETLYMKMIKANAITSPKDIWWDIRPSPGYGTLEIRVCDGLPTLEETVMVTALVHSLSKFIDQQIVKGRRFAPPPDWIMRENKWRASRHGVDASLIVKEDGECQDVSALLQNLVTDLTPIIESYGYQKEFEALKTVLREGPSYIRQRAVGFMVGGNLKKVTEFLADEFDARVPLWKRMNAGA
ncbi:MAG TPA: YbdK family carboxylate-amine ligase [Bdellovibrionales bacterium]|jgi:carboxylate-amine ligase|nr:YbdK family carboxylate-amine ligase [Bdellovibrionales bacterium]